MKASVQTAVRAALASATRSSDRVFLRLLQRSARRLGDELCLPADFVQLLLAVEDKRFLWHAGIDPVGIFRSAAFNVGIRPARPHGASTITQQIFSGRARQDGRWNSTFDCKRAQALWAVRATWPQSKASILRDYLESVYLGGSFYGLRMAALGYCERVPSEMSVGDAFFLVERIAWPNRVSPNRVRILAERLPIGGPLRTNPDTLVRLSRLYERHFGCGERITKCLVSQEAGRAYVPVFGGCLERSVRAFRQTFDVYSSPDKVSFTGFSGAPYSFDLAGTPAEDAEAFVECKGYRNGSGLIDAYREFLVKAYCTSVQGVRHQRDLFWFVTNVSFGSARDCIYLGTEFKNQRIR